MILSLETLRKVYDDQLLVMKVQYLEEPSFRDWLEEEILDSFIFRHRDGSLNDIDEHQAFYESFESKLKEK